jgi:6-phosphogluconolactonase
MRFVAAAFVLLAGLAFPETSVAASKWFVYFGTYTGPNSKGIYVSDYDPASGRIGDIRLAGEIPRPSWILADKSGTHLYAVSELGNDARTNGEISSFTIDRATGKLTFINKVSSGGGGACHLALDKDGKTLFVADYGSGRVAAIRIKADGSLGDQTAIDQHSGSSINPARQKGPHAHSVVLSPDDRYLFVPDLGLDKIFSYKLDPAAGSLTPNNPPFATVTPGSGPRHMAFHPNGKFAYVVDEMGSKVSAFTYDRQSGKLTPFAEYSALPKGFSGVSNAAEIAIDAKGAHLYASNRGADTIAVFDIDAQSGKLSKVQDMPTQGRTPRNFRLDPSGKFLLAANQDTSNVVVFRVDTKNGRLTPAGLQASVPSPVCILFLKK